MALQFLDTNVLLRHLLQDDAEQSPASTAFLARVESGDAKVRISETVVFETVFTLERRYRASRREIRDAVLPLIELPGVVLPGKRKLRRVFDLYASANLPFADAYHAVLMQDLGIGEIVSYDRDFDRLPGLKRVEP